MLVNAKDMVEKAYHGKYAICQFNINNLEWAKFILEECNINNAPVIIGVSVGAAKYMGGFKTVFLMVSSLINELNIKIPVALHLDHGGNFEDCKSAIDAGFTSIMIDASKYEIDENIRITKSVVNYAGDGITVEAEVGHVGGQEDEVIGEIHYASVEDSVKIVNSTGIFMLAPALGSVHGLYKGDPKLNFERMLEISKLVQTPLVLHGGTGIYDEQIKTSLQCGIAKININTDLQLVWTESVRKFLEEDKTEYDPRKVIGAGEVSIKNKVKEKLILTESINRA